MTVARIGGPDGSTLSREIKRSMPITHAKSTKVPMLLVYSSSDRVTRPAEVLAYATKAVGDVTKAIPVEFEGQECEGHGDVPDAGFAPAIAWLRDQCTMNQVEATDETTLVSQNVEDPADSLRSVMQTSPVEQSRSQSPSVTPAPPQSRPVVPVQSSPPRSRTQPPPASQQQGVQQNPYFTD